MSDMRDYKIKALQDAIARDPIGWQMRQEYDSYKFGARMLGKEVMPYEKWEKKNKHLFGARDLFNGA